MKKILVFAAIILSLQAVAQNISYAEYMERVFKDNIALTAKSLDLDIADAGVTESKVFNDPTLAVSYTNNEDWSKGLGQGIEVELGKTFTFGVRRERMNIAESERKQTIALLEEYMRNFRADATIAYLEHLRAGMVHAEAIEVYKGLNEVATNDSIRFIKGDIAESEWLESRMAQGVARNAVLDAEAQLCNTAIMMGYYMNSLAGAEELRGTGTLDIDGEPAPMQEYINTALERRPDIIVALERADMAKARARFNKAQRRPELDVNIGATYNFSNPDFTTLKAGIAVPLKFSSLNKGARIIDEAVAHQAEIEVSEALEAGAIALLLRSDDHGRSAEAVACNVYTEGSEDHNARRAVDTLLRVADTVDEILLLGDERGDQLGGIDLAVMHLHKVTAVTDHLIGELLKVIYLADRSYGEGAVMRAHKHRL